LEQKKWKRIGKSNRICPLFHCETKGRRHPRVNVDFRFGWRKLRIQEAEELRASGRHDESS
jgi:hypothetical protein